MEKKNKRTRSLRYNILFFTAIGIIIPLVVFVYISYQTYEKSIEKNSSRYSLQLTRQIGTNLDLKLGQYKDMLMQIITNRSILSSLREISRDEQAAIAQRKLSSQVTEYISVAPEFKSIAFLTDQRYIRVMHRWKDQRMHQQVYQSTLADKNQFQWFGGREQTYRDSVSVHSSRVFSLAKEVYDIDNGNSLDMVIVIDIQNRILEDICDKISNAELPMDWCITDRSGELIFKSDGFINITHIGELFNLDAEQKSYYTKADYGGRTLLAGVTRLEVNGWNIVTTLDYQYVRQEASESVRPVLAVFLLLLLVISGGTAVLVRVVANPINNLAKEMRYPAEGNFTHKAEGRTNGIEEFADLQASYNFMLEKINELIKKVYEEGEQKRIVQIKALESQINPHFLYNTLDTIKWTALLQKADNAAEMASMLSKLLHISLGKGRDKIKVADEVEHVKAYVGIQRYRLDLQFDVVYVIDNDTKDCLVPKILLQPIVENSILHGFSKDMHGEIRIICRREADRLVFMVTDNGQGFDDSNWRKDKEQRHTQRFSGIGVANVDERIRLICGQNYGLTVTSEIGVGTTVRIELPVEL